jgi:hypothetical protein
MTITKDGLKPLSRLTSLSIQNNFTIKEKAIAELSELKILDLGKGCGVARNLSSKYKHITFIVT